MPPRKAVVVGISGASSSGKTTLARLLRDIFPSTFILHEDDFYKPEDQLPMRDGLLDWDCEGAISVPDMARALEHIRAEGTFPPFVDSKEDQNSVGQCPVPADTISRLQARVAAWTQPGQPGHSILVSNSSPSSSSSSPSSSSSSSPSLTCLPIRICLLDGFLLYSPPTTSTPTTTTCTSLSTISPLLDLRVFLLVSKARATARREARDGYVTLEGFWTDPPGYVDRVVWPNYVESHAWLFRDGDVEGGRLDEGALRAAGVASPSLSVGDEVEVADMGTTLEWMVGLVIERLEELAGLKG